MKLRYQLLCKTCFLYSPLLIQIYWITCYVGSLTSGSDHSSNEQMTSCNRCYCDLSSNGCGDALEPVATVIHQNPIQKDKHIYNHYPSKVNTKS
jgi:hypothetical protein